MDKLYYLTPWQKKQDDFYFARYSIGDNFRRAIVYLIEPYKKTNDSEWAGSETGNKLCKTKKEIMKRTDKELVDRGYILLTQEQYDKLIILV
jgi:hypothetical protein